MKFDHFSSAPPVSVRVPAHRLRREALLLSALSTLVLFGLSLLLITWRVEQLLTDLSQQRVLRLTQQISLEAERGMRFGVSLPEQGALLDRLQQLKKEEPQLLAILLRAPDGTVIAQTGELQTTSSIAPHWHRQVAAAAHAAQPWVKHENARAYIARPLTDATGQTSAALWAVVDTSATQAQAHAAALRILGQIAPLLALTLALAWWALWRLGLQWQSPDGAPRQRQPFVLALVATLVCVATPLTMAWSAREAARPLVAQQIAENADVLGRTLSLQMARALHLGIPMAQLQGVGELFQNALEQAPELSYLGLRSASAEDRYATYQAGSAPSSAQDQIVLRSAQPALQDAHIVVGYPANYVDRQLAGMLLDFLLALVVSTVLMLECARGRWQRSALAALASQRLALRWAALRRRLLPSSPALATPAATAWSAATTEQMIRLRFIIFLIALSEELLRPFFTVFAIDMPPQGLAMSPTMVAGLPVAAFMATLALAQPLGPVLAQRFDLRLGLLLSALAGSVALAATGLVGSALALVVLRALAGMAYGLALILAQTALVRITPPQQRARGMTQIAGAIVAAGIVGPPFGGMVAAQAGPVAGFVACAACMVLAALVCRRLHLAPATASPTDATDATASPAPSTTGGWRGYWAVVSNRRALSVIFGAALPARLVAVTVLVVVVPLQMSALQQPAAMTGRALLLYFLVFAVTVSLFANWSDSSGKRTPFLVAGGLLSALACWALPGLGGVLGMAACCALLGLGQAMQSSPQLALVTEIFERPSGNRQQATPEQALAAFRLLERLGSIAAPFATAWAVAVFDYEGAMVAIGIFLAVATLGMLPGLRANQAPSLSPSPVHP